MVHKRESRSLNEKTVNIATARAEAKEALMMAEAEGDTVTAEKVTRRLEKLEAELEARTTRLLEGSTAGTKAAKINKRFEQINAMKAPIEAAAEMAEAKARGGPIHDIVRTRCPSLSLPRMQPPVHSHSAPSSRLPPLLLSSLSLSRSRSRSRSLFRNDAAGWRG